MKIGKEELLTISRVGKGIIIEHENEILEKMRNFSREEFFKLQSGLKKLKEENYKKYRRVIDGVHGAYREKFGGSLNADYNGRSRPDYVFVNRNIPGNKRKKPTSKLTPSEQHLKEKIDSTNPVLEGSKKESSEIGDLTGTVDNLMCPKVSISNNRIQVYDSRDICILTVDLKDKSVCLHNDKFRIDSSVGRASVEDIEKVNRFKSIIQSISEQMDLKSK